MDQEAVAKLQEKVDFNRKHGMHITHNIVSNLKKTNAGRDYPVHVHKKVYVITYYIL